LSRKYNPDELFHEGVVKALEADFTIEGRTDAEIVVYLSMAMVSVRNTWFRRDGRLKRGSGRVGSLRAGWPPDSSSGASDGDFVADQTPVIERVESKETWERVAVEITRLPERYRVVVQKRHIEGKGIGDIAEEVGISKEEVSRRLYQSVRLLRQRLRQGPGDQ
jgi:RNA polymerase sigma factor (sigma-70 family)